MVRIALLVAATTAALALAGSSPAKEVSSVELCGPDSCAAVTDREALVRFAETTAGADVATGPAVPSAYYVVRVSIDDGTAEQHHWESFYLPGARVVRSVDEHGRASWRRAPKAERAFLDAMAAGVRAFPEPEVTTASVGKRPVVAAATYLGLYRLKRTPRAWPKRRGWQRIRLGSTVGSPWTDGANVLRYLPRERLLERDGEYVRLSKRLARAVRNAAALRISG
jgi:hypothetical protein